MRSLIIILLVIGLGACGKMTPEPPKTEPRIVVCTTVYPLADVVRQIGGDHVKLDWIIDLGDPLAGYSMTENERNRLTGVDFLVCNGSSTDGWAFQPIQSISETGKIISLEDAKISSITAVPGARWLDPHIIRQLARTLAEKFAQKMPHHKEQFFANADRFIATLDVVSKSKKPSRQKMIVTTTLYGPLLDRVGIAGVLIDIDPLHYTEKEIRRIKATAQKENISRIILPFDTPPGTVADIEARTGLRTCLIDLLGKPQFTQHSSYIEILSHNLEQLSQQD